MAKGQLSAGSLGGRFLRRTNPHTGQSVPSRNCEREAMATQAKQAVTEGNRLVRTSAAMIGLAVSVGACGLSLSHNGDQAVAAEPSSTDATASSAPNSFETAAILAPSENSTDAAAADQRIRHTVQEGQTLWDVARFYQIDASTLASVNQLSLDSVLQVGQVLIVPTDTRVAQAVDAASNSVMPGYYGHVPSVVASSLPSTVASADAQLKANQDLAVETLRQKQASLRSSLEKLNTRSPQATVAESAPAVVATAEPLPTPSVAVLPSPVAPAAIPSNVAPVPTPDASPSVALQSPSSFAVSSPAAVGAVNHQVVPGDTLSSIARSHGLTIQQLMQANRISNPDFIFVGQTLVIPTAQPGGLATSRLNNAIAAAPRNSITDVPSAAVLPAPMGGSNPQADSIQIAAASRFNTAPRAVETPVDSGSNLLQYNHVEKLKQEIDRMREQRFQAESARSQSATRNQPVVVTPVAARPAQATVTESVNPEFNPDRYSRLQEIRNRIRPVSDRTTATTPQPRQATQVIAAAPLGSESYDPVTSRLGQTVSPSLPSLGNGSEFLPSVPGQSENFIWPTRGVLTSGYGPRWGRMHKGIDIAGPVGTPIVAAADGRVTYAGWNSGGYGYLVEIQHPDGSLTLYAHNNRILVQVGQEVAQGDQIAEMGSTGYSTGPHLHFEIHPTGRGAVNPMPFLQARR